MSAHETPERDLLFERLNSKARNSTYKKDSAHHTSIREELIKPDFPYLFRSRSKCKSGPSFLRMTEPSESVKIIAVDTIVRPRIAEIMVVVAA